MRKAFLRGGAALLAFVLIVLAVCVINALRMPSRQITVDAPKPLAIDVEAAAKRLAEAVRLKTVTRDRGKVEEPAAFDALHALLEESYPQAHEALKREKIAELSLLYTWEGSDPSLAPVVLLAHQDVVPIADPDAWSVPPFEGRISDGFVWGRGTIDDKASVLGILEAVEQLIAGGFTPRRTVLLAFGHDEEVGGLGAKAIVERIAASYPRPYLVLDEGSLIVKGVVPGLSQRVALVGITEKGYATLEVSARAKGGHSSMPPDITATGKLARVITALETNPMPASLDGPVALQFDYLGPEMSFGLKLAMANRWLLGSVVEGAMAKTAAGRAQLRTTTAVTMLDASPKENVLAPTATAVVNFRIRPGETVESIRNHVIATVGDDVEVAVREGANDPPPASPITGEVFSALHETIAAVFPDAVFAPSLVVATTDARHWAGHADNVYRFMPITLSKDDLARFHGVDERIGIETYAESIRFFAALLERVAGQAP